MIGEIYINMIERDRPLYGSSSFMLKHWTKYNIYSKSGSYLRTDNPNENQYQTCSTYLYDYVVVSKDFYSNIVYTASVVDTTPSVDSDWVEANRGWQHREGTFRNSPNATVNNYILTYDSVESYRLGHPVYTTPYIYTGIENYFEIVRGYPRNHYTHKRSFFSLFRTRAVKQTTSGEITYMYVRNRQDNTTTIGEDGITDGTDPIQTFDVGNVSLYRTDNIINA